MKVDEAVTIEQAVHIHRNAPTAIIGGFFVACLLASAFWGVADQVHVASWLLVGATLVLGRMIFWRRYDAQHFTLPGARQWLRDAMTGAALSGCLWGVGSFIFFPPHEFIYHVIFVFGVAMMGVAAMFSYGSHFRTFMAFFYPAAIPAVVGLLAQGTMLHVEVALGIATYIVVAMRFMANFNRLFLKSLHLRFENVNLVNELTVQKEAAESANHAKSRFLAAASHDLRQPMHALTLYLSALSGHALPQASRVMVGNVRQCAQIMEEMFRALLDISRLDAGAVRAEISTFAVTPLLHKIKLEFEPQAHARGLVLKVGSCSRFVRSDPVLVERILRNFISNAMRYCEHGRVLVTCRVRARSLRIAVHDSGPGIEPAERRKIFEEFYQIGNPERDRAKGIGLGLAIVERLSRLLDAPLTLTSKPGRGSMFAIDLPLALSVTQAPARSLKSDTGSTALAGTFVVVVDDEEPILDATRQVLEQWQCKVVTATSGAQAMARLATSTSAPDLLICDFRLRDHENGIQVIEALRAEFNADIPALLVSGDSAPVRIRQAEASGLRVLHKPFDDDALRAVVSKVLEAEPVYAD